MKALVPFFSILSSVVTVIATMTRLSWHRKQIAPGPTPEQTNSQKFLRIAAGIWLIAIVAAAIIGVLVILVPQIIKMSNVG